MIGVKEFLRQQPGASLREYLNARDGAAAAGTNLREYLEARDRAGAGPMRTLHYAAYAALFVFEGLWFLCAFFLPWMTEWMIGVHLALIPLAITAAIVTTATLKYRPLLDLHDLRDAPSTDHRGQRV
jgi:hypothetical protein